MRPAYYELLCRMYPAASIALVSIDEEGTRTHAEHLLGEESRNLNRLLYFRIQINQDVPREHMPRAIEAEVDGTMRDLAQFIRTDPEWNSSMQSGISQLFAEAVAGRRR